MRLVPYAAQRVVTTTLLLLRQATIRGERSMHPPVAKPAQPTLTGAVMVRYRGNGADWVSGMASEMSSPTPGSENLTVLRVWHWTSETARARTALESPRNIILNVQLCDAASDSNEKGSCLIAVTPAIVDKATLYLSYPMLQRSGSLSSQAMP
jgi:hypothetical protein